jgi:glyoxylase-like metal-dependent hydrolase (beta-lactamase superfamily II)
MTFHHTVRVAFLDVGQGDSTVVTVPATQEAVIIDCPEADVVFEYLKSEQVLHIRALIITHLHLDHYKDAVNFLENCSLQLGLECEPIRHRTMISAWVCCDHGAVSSSILMGRSPRLSKFFNHHTRNLGNFLAMV